MRFIRVIILAVVGLLILVACGDEDPRRERDEISIAAAPEYQVDFESGDVFETQTFGEGEDRLAIEDGKYFIETTNQRGAGYLWGIGANYPPLKNVVVDVETQTLEGTQDNWFGVMCRVDENDGGYVFLISADGFWAIARAEKGRLSFLENWRESDSIRKGHNQTNDLRVYCVEDYLALYVNGDFVGDHENKRFNHVGAVGLLAGGQRNDRIVISFDNLKVYAAALRETPNTPAPATLAPTLSVPELSVPTLQAPELFAPPAATEEVPDPIFGG